MYAVLLLLAVLCGCAPQALAQTELRIAVFISGLNTSREFTGLGMVDGRQFRVATELAVEAVNNNTSLLPDYNLQAFFVDSQCSAGPSVRGYIDQIFSSEERVLIIGSDCSTATESITELAPSWGLVQISPLSTSPAFSNSENFLRLIPSDVAAAEGVVSLMERFDWSRLGIITQQETSFTETMGQLENLLGKRNFSIVSEVTFNTRDNPRPFLESLENSPARIIFLNVYPAYAVEILCLAFTKGMTSGNGYQWLLYPWYPDQWWVDSASENPNTPYPSNTCPRGNIEVVLDRALVIEYLPMADQGSNLPTPVDLSLSQYEQLLRERLSAGNFSSSLFQQTHLYFDSVILAALALHTTAESYDLSQFNYNMTDPVSFNITRDLYSNALNTSFQGVSGLVNLAGVRDRQPVIRFKQYRQISPGGLELVFVGNLSYFESNVTLFPGGVPSDERNLFIAQPLFIVLTILSFVGIVFAVGVAIFIMIFRKRTVIKHSSPYLNLLIIAGTVLLFIVVILFGIDEGTPASTCTVNALCMARIWIAVLGFDLLFGTIFLKTWRAYYAVLSGNRRRKKDEKSVKMKIVPDWGLAVALLVVTAVDLVLLVIITILQETRLSLETFIQESTTQTIPLVVRVCTAERAVVWLIIVGMLKGIPLLFGLLLAFDLRSVKIAKLNDSKTIGTCVYSVAITSSGAVILGALLSRTEFVDVLYGVVSLLILLNNLVVLLLLFVPKIYKLYKDPEGLRVVVSPDPHMSSCAMDSVAGLADEVQRLKSELDTLNGQSNGGKLTPESRIDESLKIRENNGSGLIERKSVHFSPDH